MCQVSPFCRLQLMKQHVAPIQMSNFLDGYLGVRLRWK